MALLRRVEAMMKEVLAEQKRYRSITEELTALKAEKAANLANGRERVALCRARKRKGSVTPASIKASRSLYVEKKDLKSLPHVVTETLPDHPSLIAHFAEVIQRVAGVKYDFSKEDGKHASTLLKRYGLDEARRVVDLAASRFQREPFYRNVGLTLRLVANDANKLRTANGKPIATIEPLWQKQGFNSAEEYAEHLAALPMEGT